MIAKGRPGADRRLQYDIRQQSSSTAIDFAVHNRHRRSPPNYGNK